jgi:hypothetical protein
MIFFKKYSSIPKYLDRFTIIKFLNIHIRIHKILSEDKTPYYHNHPFSFMSLILKGGYTEEILRNNSVITKNHNRFNFIFRHKNTYHKIKFVKNNTITLFFAIGNNKKWHLKSIEQIHERPKNGIYKRIINNKKVYSKCEDGMFYIGSHDINVAKNENRLSIYQDNENINKWSL